MDLKYWVKEFEYSGTELGLSYTPSTTPDIDNIKVMFDGPC